MRWGVPGGAGQVTPLHSHIPLWPRGGELLRNTAEEGVMLAEHTYGGEAVHSGLSANLLVDTAESPGLQKGDRQAARSPACLKLQHKGRESWSLCPWIKLHTQCALRADGAE